ncbi:UDP-N-acetylmuramoyl-L-alanyl-D-glutamate--2,6-diaminopimelate ligase [Chryseobacterium carnipullorum]|uniref:UDP-N-acetylmuramoyl-L-alanyl-D-glutamate--2,6-diaminopimelate ligase n=1 Tax=Chryseobacterium carnipullorum TaxID=1124835 RepID=A0A376ESR1_CHRCU|nr:UDP-N-acetylmuramoyl-L-alanyl-D-glutamate--2,6-diaminopimelate ligase [Chryseobacterium carnipullorum]MDN5477798.1 UDP-N-acetylmuramoyl-L-alanyl-D-glutamate--2,6-diaminopimelate ligase [Chryseobacterium sp.]AZA47941.1 UDP-N-acetylmuramoyl-L-alanyl-D-glutamate--2,6-diaminopimelate ligase [Chryseobacterium carnipullorum]AZA67257.1 UDP-N-acetylmuramoyl-L-alanyl-D-glutamate--2,6-diaminopimelate ligase [Chryseobacterium carnipullorum]STD12913.1 UDP-N-acetylmuramoyl-L-alanyl-D-glutamate--2,6-diami
MIITELLKRIPVLEIHGDDAREVSELVFDSRKITENSLYVAVRGTVADGHSYIASSVEKGAKAVVCEEFPETMDGNVTYIKVKDSSKTLGHLASNFYGNPSQKLKLIGVTGTNGKTSVSTLLFDVFQNLGYDSALLSTVEIRIADEIIPATHTTPDVITINKILAQAVEKGCEFAFMEVSSHGIAQNRIEGLHFKIAGFTNLTHDHLDYHKTFDEYLKTKKRFFDGLEDNAVAITNVDDKNGMVMLQNTKAKKKSYALKTMADYHGKSLEIDFNGMLLNFNGKEFWTTLTGRFNVYNLLLVFGIASELGFEQDEILQAISKLKRVSGRFETFKSDGGIFFIVDYAHTPDALENILDSINDIRTKNERLITVFGCGGDRDHSKRPEMGNIATRKSTLAIITSDNPRTEDPAQIIKEIEAGVESQNFSKYTSIPDRREAIKMAIKFAEPKDIVLVAGKGHETYQDMNGVKHHFDDKETIIELWKLMSK